MMLMISYEDSKTNEENINFEKYYINDELHAMIKLTQKPYNSVFTLIGQSEGMLEAGISR